MLNKLAFLAATAIVAATAPLAVAQANGTVADYPNKPLRLMVGFPPGGVADIVARITGPALAERLGQPVLVDNRAGAGGIIGADAVAKATPDGYTIGFGITGALTSSVTLMPKLPYQPLKDLAFVSRVVNTPLVLVVNTSLNVNSVKDFIAFAKSRPGNVTYGTAGPGTVMNLAGEMLKQEAGFDMAHAGYKGSSPALVDLLANHIEAAIVDLAAVKPYSDAGRVKVLAITSAKRSVLAPDVPTMAEAGVPGYALSGWFGLIMPANTPPEIVNKVNAELAAVLKDPKIREQMLAAKVEPAPSTPQEFRATVETEIKKFATLIKAANIKLD
jgi:tripartite-type tricarboxylate transporter receptor subunit TctC